MRADLRFEQVNADRYDHSPADSPAALHLLMQASPDGCGLVERRRLVTSAGSRGLGTA
jgi:hypothetical protein